MIFYIKNTQKWCGKITWHKHTQLQCEEVIRGQAELFILWTICRAFNLISLKSDQLQSRDIHPHHDYLTFQQPTLHCTCMTSMFIFFCATVKETVNMNKLKVNVPLCSFKGFHTENIGTSNCHCALRCHYSACPLVSACTLHTSFLFQEKKTIPISDRQKTHRQFHSGCLILGFHCIELSILVQFHFYFFFSISICTPSSFSLMCPTQKQPMFSLLFQYLLGELGQMNSYKHTHASTHVHSSCTHWTLACNRPANSDLKQKYLRKAT